MIRKLCLVFALALLPSVAGAQVQRDSASDARVLKELKSQMLVCTFDQAPGHMSGQARDTLRVELCDCCTKRNTAKKSVAGIPATKPRPRSTSTASKSLTSIPRTLLHADTTVIKRDGVPDSMIVMMHFDSLHVDIRQSLLYDDSASVGFRSSSSNSSSNSQEKREYIVERSWFRDNARWVIPSAIVTGAAIAIIGTHNGWFGGTTVNNVNSITVIR